MKHQENRMASRLVVGLFHSSGIAEDAVHRLMTEGIAPRDIARRLLKEVGLIPPVPQPELAVLEVDQLVLGNVRAGFAQLIHNGETAVFVRTVSDEQVEFAADILKQYVPITIEVVPLPEGPQPPAAR
jgi:hypothetical protein